MGIDYLVCSNCKDTFNENGPYIQCNCIKNWCSIECAEEDGYIEYNCPRSCEFCTKTTCIGEENCHKTYSCMDCEHTQYCNYEDGNPRSCKFCRHEDVDDDKLLIFILDTIHMTRENAIKLYNKGRDNK